MIKIIGAVGAYYGGPKKYRDAYHIVSDWERKKKTEEERIKEAEEVFKIKKRTRRTTKLPQWGRIVPDKLLRTGGRKADAIEPHLLGDKFNIENIQPGKYVTEDDAKDHLKGIHGGLMDLADILGVEDKKLGFKKELSIAIGARGGGDAKAHYEPNNTIINITKMAGGGSLGHEWAHALDNIISRTHTTSTAEKLYMSHGVDDGVTAPVRGAWREVMDTIKYAGKVDVGALETARKYRAMAGGRRKLHWLEKEKWKKAEKQLESQETQFYSDAQALSPAVDGYHQRPREMFARCFESYVEDALLERGRESSYLVSGTKVQYVTGRAKKGVKEAQSASDLAQPYAKGEERKRINAAMAKLIEVLREEGTLQKALDMLFVVPL